MPVRSKKKSWKSVHWMRRTGENKICHTCVPSLCCVVLCRAVLCCPVVGVFLVCFGVFWCVLVVLECFGVFSVFSSVLVWFWCGFGVFWCVGVFLVCVFGILEC